MINKPLEINDDEWKEIFELDKEKELGFGCDSMDSLEELKSMCYGVKFDFVSGCPSYVGDVFILLGDGYCAEPLVLEREYNTKKLRIADLEHNPMR